MAKRVNWLVDNLETLENLFSIYQKEKLNLKVNIEIDVGLHRGGV
jgi:D-serine deaminase-like pyridoxal phosphate-dependent protein